MTEQIPQCPLEPKERVGSDKSLGSIVIKLAAIVAAIVVLWQGGTMAADTRYATVDRVNSVQKEAKEEISRAKELILTKMDYVTDQSRKTQLDDKIYELQQVPEYRRSNDQRAALERYTRQFHEINARWVNPPPGVKQH